MRTYAVRGATRKMTGHYRRPGTRELFCGRPAGAPNDDARQLPGFRLCALCVKAEAADRATAEHTLAAHTLDGLALADRAGVTLAMVGRGKLPHYAYGDNTLCGRPVDGARRTEQAAKLVRDGIAVCARCTSAADARAYARRLATTAPLARAAVALAATVEQADTDRATGRVRCTVHGDQCDHNPRRRHIYRPAADQDPTPIEDAEAMLAVQLVTEAEATDGTWRGGWIGEQPDADTLFTIEPATEQGALFTPGSRVVCADGRERTVERIVERPGEPACVVVEGGAEWIADNCRPATTPARRVIEGVVVEHNGTATGSTPATATHPNVIAARAALDGLAAATLTDHHDVTDPTDNELDVRGYMVDPREGDRVAVYWLEAGRIIRRDDPAHGPALDCLADRLTRRGWTVEPMLKSSKCVFAHRPQ